MATPNGASEEDRTARERRKGTGPPTAAVRKAAKEARRATEAAAEQAPPDFAPTGRPSDVFGGELRRRDVFTVLIFHLISNSASGASYGNQLIERIQEITAGAISLNPNTIYPLLRELEAEGFIEGRWEHPEKRSRRLYTITEHGGDEYARLRTGLEPFLDSIVQSITLIKREIYGSG
jgi:PadR family transcriptional regulator, regulatory protein PadR